MSYLARDPLSGIDSQANDAGGRRNSSCIGVLAEEAAGVDK